MEERLPSDSASLGVTFLIAWYYWSMEERGQIKKKRVIFFSKNKFKILFLL
jgi:hypothetical protein